MTDENPYVDQYVSFHTHTDGSVLDGFSTIDDIVNEVVRLKQPAVAISDHGNVFNGYNLYVKAREKGIKPIIAIEAYVAPSTVTHTDHEAAFFSDGGSDDVSGRGAYTHVLLIAENNIGLKNLYRLSYLSYKDGFYRKPRMSMELFREYHEGLIATTGCPSGEIQTKLRLGMYDSALEHAREMQSIFGKDNYFMELMDHNMTIDLERKVTAGLLAISKELGIPLLATNDSHYTTKEDANAHEHLLAIATRSKMSVPTSVAEGEGGKTRFAFDGSGYYLRSHAEMIALFPEDKFPGAVSNSILIANRCNITIEPDESLRPRIPLPEGYTEAEWLSKEAYEGLARRLPDKANDKEYLDRMAKELDVINGKNFSGYFLVTSDFVRWARNNGVPVGFGRGSAAGSLLAFALDITDPDPIRHGLLFERFLNPERDSPPDIDMDFNDLERELVIQYVKDTYGDDYVAQVVTFGKILAKNGVKDTVRILDEPYSLGDELTKAMPAAVFGKTMPLNDIYTPGAPRYEEAEDFRAKVKERGAENVIAIARQLEGRIRSTGVHAAALVISSKPVVDYIPMMVRQVDGAKITQWDYPTAEALGLIKMDFLGLRNLGIVRDAIANIEKTKGIKLDVQEIIQGVMDDPKTYELLQSGNTLGVFQLDGGGLRNLLKLLKPTHFGDISAVLSLYRPGPMGVNAHTDYALRKNGLQEVDYIHPELTEAIKPILDESFGLCVAGDTMVWDAQNGKLVRIDSIGDKVANGNFFTFSTNTEGDIESKKVTHHWSTGVKSLHRVTLSSGHVLEASATHPVYTTRGWVNIGDLKEDDKLAIPRNPISLEKGIPKDSEEFSKGYQWSSINSINIDGTATMYDITVEDNHNFIANGILVSNCIYQEQVQLIAQKVAGYSLGQADLLRRAMGKKKRYIIDAEYVPFSEGARKNGYSDEAIKALWDILVPFADYAFNKCTSGDTKVYLSATSQHTNAEGSITVKELYDRLHAPMAEKRIARKGETEAAYAGLCMNPACAEKGIMAISSGRGRCHACKSWLTKFRNSGLKIRAMKDGRIKVDRILDVVQNGTKTLYEMTLANGMSIKTTLDHRHFTLNGWLELNAIHVGDSVAHEGSYEGKEYQKTGAGKGWAKGLTGVPSKDGLSRPQLHGIISEFDKNAALLDMSHCDECDKPSNNTAHSIEIAHLDSDRNNSALDNLRPLCNSCHKTYDIENGTRSKRMEKGFPVEYSEVVSIEYVGEETTYDIEMEGAEHNYVANGIVTHNSHTVAYGLLSYVTAFLKANYLSEYMAALLTSVSDDVDKTALYLEDCRQNGIKVSQPNVSRSQVEYAPLSDTEVSFGLRAIRGVGATSGEQIVASRVNDAGKNVPFKDFSDFITRIPKSLVNKRIIEGLTYGGALDTLGVSRRAIIHQLPEILKRYQKAQKSKGSTQTSLFDLDDIVEYDVLQMDEFPKMEKLKLERHALGLYISAHPIDGLNIANMASARVAGLLDGTVKPLEGWPTPRDTPVRIAGIVTSLAVKRNKKGEPFAIIKLEDRSGSIECAIFPKTYAKVGEFLKLDGVYQLVGFSNKRDEEINFIVDNVRPLEFSESGNLSVRLKLTEQQWLKGERSLEAALRRHLVPLGETGDDVIISVKNLKGEVWEERIGLKVRRSPALLQEVQELFGSLCVGRWLRTNKVEEPAAE
jgi:DNA-directed DNA polymerase III PolC